MSDRSNRLTRRQQRLSEKTTQKPKREREVNSSNLQLKHVAPVTDNQRLMFDYYEEGGLITAHGFPGTGKTFLSMYLALRDVFDKRTPYKKLVIIRSAQPSKQIGFLKGSDREKIAVYETAYKAHCTKLFGRGDAYEVLVNKGYLEFQSTSFLRGTEIEDSIVLIDEVQNLSYQEAKTAITRISGESRLIIAGDTKQDDLTSERFNETSGVSTLMEVLNRMPSAKFIQFSLDDIVRHGLIREYILAEHQLGLV